MYQKELEFLKDTFREAFRLHAEKSVVSSAKGSFDLVTNIDKAIESFVVDEIRKSYPTDRIHAEEFSSDVSICDRTWILDPIDGTYNFSGGLPIYALQGALFDRGEVQISVIYFPMLSEIYYAHRGRGAFCNDHRLSVSERPAERALVSFGDFPHHRPFDRYNQSLVFERAKEKVARLRMFGAASMDFAALASGKTEGVVLFTKKQYDLAPGLLLAEEAGAHLFAPSGEKYSMASCGVIAVNDPCLFDTLTKGIGFQYDSGI